MTPFDPRAHHRRSIRLKGYDYAHPGAYFVTICTQDRACLLGRVADGVMCPNDAGRMVRSVWNDIQTVYPGVETDAFVVMPNHVHAIIILVAYPGTPNQPGRPFADDAAGQARGPAPTALALPDVVHRFKSLTTRLYADGVR